MKLIGNPKWPHYLKRDPESGVWRVYTYMANKKPKRLDMTTGESESIERAKKLALVIYEKWLGHRLDGGRTRVLFSTACIEKLERMESQLISKKIRIGTMKNAQEYLGATKILIRTFGPLYLDQITVGGTWDGFVARFQKQHPGKTLFNVWKHMNMVMTHAYKAGYIEKPWEAKNPDPEKKDERVPSALEVTNIFANALPNLRDQMLFASTMGMRKMEHFRQSYDPNDCCHVDMEAKTVTVCEDHSKTHKARVMQMSPQVEAMLTARKAGVFTACDGYQKKRKVRSTRWIFPARLKPDTFTNSNRSAWRTAKEKAQIFDTLKYHWLRRYFLTEAAKLVREGKVSIVLVCNYAGLNIKTFEKKYLKLNHNDTAPVAALVAVKLREHDNQPGAIH